MFLQERVNLLKMPDLHRAAFRDDVEEIKRLLEKGSDPFLAIRNQLLSNVTENKEMTPLAITIWMGHLEAANLLASTYSKFNVSFSFSILSSGSEKI